MYLSWIIPAYNESLRIEKTLREVDRYLRSRNFPGEYEILVVDNSSKDGTSEIVEKLTREIKGLRLLKTQGPGKGWAVREGMLNSAGEIRMFSDADNSVSPEQADNFLPLVCVKPYKVDCFDVVIGSIEIAGSKIEEQAQWYRRLLGKFSKYIIRFISGLWEIHDSQRGFKFFSSRAAKFIFTRQTITGWGFDFEVLLIAKRNDFKIREVPVRWINPPDSKVRLDAYVVTLVELLKVKWNDIRGIYRSHD